MWEPMSDRIGDRTSTGGMSKPVTAAATPLSASLDQLRMAANDASLRSKRGRKSMTANSGANIDAKQIERLVAEGLRILGLPQGTDLMLPNIPQQISSETKSVNVPTIHTSIGNSTR
jgi:hypothetical protein